MKLVKCRQIAGVWPANGITACNYTIAIGVSFPYCTGSVLAELSAGIKDEEIHSIKGLVSRAFVSWLQGIAGLTDMKSFKSQLAMLPLTLQLACWNAPRCSQLSMVMGLITNFPDHDPTLLTLRLGATRFVLYEQTEFGSEVVDSSSPIGEPDAPPCILPPLLANEILRYSEYDPSVNQFRAFLAGLPLVLGYHILDDRDVLAREKRFQVSAFDYGPRSFCMRALSSCGGIIEPEGNILTQLMESGQVADQSYLEFARACFYSDEEIGTTALDFTIC